MEIHVDKYGSFVSQKYERILIKDIDGKNEIPIKKISGMYLGSGGAISNSALIKLIDYNVPIFLMDRDVVKGIFLKYPYSERVSILTKQINLEENKKRMLSKKMIIAKIKNQNKVLYLLKKTDNNIEYNIEYYKKIIDNINKISGANWKDELRSYESQFAKYYWNNIRNVIEDFPGREKRGANFHFNASLNYAYAILSSKVYNELLKSGLDPFIPLFHSETDWKKSLVYDVMECFRPNIDKAIISLNTLKVFNKEIDFDSKNHLLTSSGKRKVIIAVNSLLNSEKLYKNEKMKFSNIIQKMCKRLKKSIMEGNEFDPYIWV